MATEIEIKLAFEKGSSEPQIKSFETVLKSFGSDYFFSKKDLENVYFDTAELLLNKNKVALRIRRKLTAQGQAHFIQTLKTAGKSEDGLSLRGEWEWALAQDELDLDKLVTCEGWPAKVNGRSLQRAFETNFTRFACELTWGKSLIELVLDWGNILSNGKSERIHEIELELKQGETADLLALSQYLQEALPVRPLDISKAERGFNLFRAGQGKTEIE